VRRSYGKMADDKAKYTLAVSLLQKLCRAEKERNFVFSPLSLGTALAMLTGGLKGEAKTELLQFFGAVDDNELHSMYSALLSKKDSPMTVANKYLADERCEIHQQFESLMKEKYESEIESVNFETDCKKIEGDVNTWIAKKTNHMIPKLLSEGTLAEDTILVILNAIHFKGSWLEAFDPVPKPLPFLLRSGEICRRSYITRTSDKFGFSSTEKLKVVTIPYKEGGFYMLLAKPRRMDDHIDEIIADMQPTELIKIIKDPKDRPPLSRLRLPKFKIEYNFESVKQCMEDLGVKKIFTEGAADFGNLFAKLSRRPSVDTIVHKAVIEVDEEGTSAAAATMAMFRLRCGPPEETFNVPFLYMVMSEDDQVCFAGICSQP